MIRKIQMERFTLISSQPFDQVLAAINDAIGHTDMAEFWRSTHRARSVAELESTIEQDDPIRDRIESPQRYWISTVLIRANFNSHAQ